MPLERWHVQFAGDTYLRLLEAAKAGAPDVHVHAFSPLEVTQGAATLRWPLHKYLTALRDAGLGSLPGTAAEVLDDKVRDIICPDKLSTSLWLEVRPFPAFAQLCSWFGSFTPACVLSLVVKLPMRTVPVHVYVGRASVLLGRSSPTDHVCRFNSSVLIFETHTGSCLETLKFKCHLLWRDT